MPNAPAVAALSLLSGVVALLISYYAYKNNRVVGSSLLRYISMGFLLLAVSLFYEGLVESATGVTPLDVVGARPGGFANLIIYSSLQLIAYVIFAWGYGLSTMSRNPGPAVGVLAGIPAIPRAGRYLLLVLTVYAVFQTGILVLLFFIVIYGMVIFSRTHSSLALTVLFGFTLIFIGHLLLFGSVLLLSNGLLTIGYTVQFCGFLALLFFLYWSGRVVE